MLDGMKILKTLVKTNEIRKTKNKKKHWNRIKFQNNWNFTLTLMQIRNVERELLMKFASFNLSFSELVRWTRSDPAKSTKHIWNTKKIWPMGIKFDFYRENETNVGEQR